MSVTALINVLIYNNWPFSGTKDYVKTNENILVPVTIFWIMTYILLACGNFYNRYPINYAFMSIHTLANSYFVSYCTCRSDSTEVLYTLAVTIFIVASVTIYAFNTKKFNFWHPTIFLISSLSLVFGIILMVSGF